MSSASSGEQQNRNLLQIGQVAEAVGLSLRTVRYYEELGLLEAVARSEGGFRLYGDEQVEQLRLIKRMKPLGLSLDEMRGLLQARKSFETSTPGDERDTARAEMASFIEVTTERCRKLEGQLEDARELTRQISAEIDQKPN